ncbi:MAG: carboxymuconolactone decarboxylase family protein [Balneola sp.]
MKALNVPTKDQVNDNAKEIFENLEKQLGMVPNIYATIGYNGDVLKSYMTFDSSIGKTFSMKEKETIKLAVSEVNGCNYCLAAHTAIAKQNGFSDEETLQLRDGSIEDEKLRTLSRLATETAKNAGKITEDSRDAFFDLGYEEKDLIDFIAVVLSVTFTNLIHNVTEIPVDFPEAKELELVEA